MPHEQRTLDGLPILRQEQIKGDVLGRSFAAARDPMYLQDKAVWLAMMLDHKRVAHAHVDGSEFAHFYWFGAHTVYELLLVANERKPLSGVLTQDFIDSSAGVESALAGMLEQNPILREVVDVAGSGISGFNLAGRVGYLAGAATMYETLKAAARRTSGK